MNIRESIRKLFGRQTKQGRPLYIRGFDGARTDELTFGFASTNNSIDVEIAGALEKLRGRSRNLAQNNDYARKFLSQVSTNVVGPSGFSLQVAASDGPKLDALANTIIEGSFSDWGRRGICEVSGQLSFVEVQQIVAETRARDGEALVRLVRGPESGNKWGFALQLVDIDRLPIGYNVDLRNGSRIVMGVEINRYGRPVAYHLHRSHPGAVPDTYAYQNIERVPATDILHLFRSMRPEQRRGVPAMHTAMLRLEMLGKFDLAAAAAARKGAETLGFFQSPNGEVLPGDATAADGNQVTTSVPGTYETLPAGYEFRPYESQYPNALYGEFVKASLRGIAAGLGVSYNSLANDLEGVNYSSIRAGVLEERDMWMAEQHWLIEAFLRPVYENWLRSALLAQAVTYPLGGALPATKLDKFLSHRWQGRRWAWVDPQKDIEANIAAINAKLKSRREVIAEQGRDIDEVWTQLQAEQDAAKALGLDLTPAKAAATQAAPVTSSG
jgi:lambda family phage portal protein